MKKLNSIVSAAALCFVFATPVFANTGAKSNPVIKSDMQVISESYTKLGKQINNPKMNSNSAKIVQTMIEKSEKAKTETPAAAQSATATDKDQVVSKYHAEMNTMISHLNEMKAALAKNDNAEAKKHFEALKPWTAPSHATEYK